MIEVRVPAGVGPQIAISYAGLPAVVYHPQGGVVLVEERRLEEFLAAVPGSEVGPPVVAEPAAEEGAESPRSPRKEKK